MKKSSLLLPIIALALPACGVGSGGGSSNISNNMVSNIRSQALYPFCMQESIALVELTSDKVQFSGGAEVGGDVILFGSGSTNFSGNGRIDGTLYISQSSQATFSGNASANQVSHQDLSAQATSISNVIANLSSLAPTQTFPSIGRGGLTIVGNGGNNVISVADGIHLSGKDALVLQGGASDFFVLNVQGDIQLSGQSSIELQGGVLAKNILINNLGLGSSIALSGQGVVSGTFFAAQRGIAISGGGTVIGSLIAGGNVSISGQGQVIQPQAFCSLEGQITLPQPTTTTTLPPTTTTTQPAATTTTTLPSTTTTTLPINWPSQCIENPMLCG